MTRIYARYGVLDGLGLRVRTVWAITRICQIWCFRFRYGGDQDVRMDGIRDVWIGQEEDQRCLDMYRLVCDVNKSIDQGMCRRESVDAFNWGDVTHP